MKGELEELGEDTDENVENLSKMQGQVLNLTHGKVNIFDNNGDFKSTYEILQGIASVWDDITDTDRAELLETVAGKHRANDIASLVQNWENVKKMKDSALNSDGSAAAEQEKYMQSMQGHLDQLAASWQAFSATTMDSGFLNGIIDGGRAAVEVFTGLIDTVGVLPTLLGVVSGALSFKNTGVFTLNKDVDDLIPKLQLLNNDVRDLPKVFKYASDSVKSFFGKDVSSSDFSKKHDEAFSNVAKSIENSKSAIASFNSTISEGISPIQAWETCFADADETIKKLVKRQVDLGNTDKGITEEQIKKIANLNAVTQVAYDKSLSSKKSLIDRFNNADELKKMGVNQLEYAEAVKKTDKYMGNHLLTVAKQNEQITAQKKALAESGKAIDGSQFKTAEASMAGYTKTLVGAKVATIGLQVASMALNAALSMGIGMLVSFAIEGLMSWVNHAQEVADKADDIKSNFNEQKKTLSQTKSTVDELSASYENLSGGVDTATNKNINLNTDDYKEYLDTVNRIADTFPNLVKGYDASGNAILSCAGNVKELNEAYKQQEKEANDEFLKGAKTVAEDSKNKADELKKATLSSTNTTKEAYDALKDLTKSGDLAKDVKNMSMNTKNAVAKALLNSGFDRETYDETNEAFILRAMQNKNKSTVQSILNDYEQQMSDAASGMKQIAEATIGNALIDTYPNMSDNMQTMVKNMVSGMDYNFFDSNKINWDSGKLTSYINDTLESINNLGDDGKKSIEVFFDIQSKLNNGDATIGEYVKSISDVEKAISGLDQDAQYQIKMSMGIQDNDLIKQYDDFKKKLVDSHGLGEDVAKSITDGLTKEQFQAFVELEAEGKINFDNVSESSIKKQLEDRVNLNKALNFTIDIDAETSGVEAVNSALSEARSATGLTSETMDTLTSRYKNLNTVSFDAAKLFEETANGISLNAEAMNEYENAYNTEKLNETTDSLKAMKEEYNNLSQQIAEAQKNGDANKVSELLGKQEDIRQKISDLAELATMYEGLTSSYNKWQQAEAAGNNRDMYQNVYSAQENIKKELDNGWIDDGTEEYFKLIWGEDKWDGAGKSVQDYRNQWATLDKTIAGTSYSINDFFKTNEDGELTSEGIFNFFDAVGQKQKELGKDWIQYDENGDMKSFNFGIDGDKAIADAMGISEELVQIFMRASQDAGFVVNFDGTYTQFADMQNAANAALSSLNDMFDTEYSFKFDTKSIDEAKNTLADAKKAFSEKGIFDIDESGNITAFHETAKGAQEAMQVVSTLQANLDQLNRHYIGLTVEDDTFQEPLDKLQDYETKVAQLNQLKLNPQANASEIEKLEGDLQGVVDYFDKLSSEQKVKLGIEGKTTDEIKSLIESGEITIPTTLDIQTKMSGDISDLKKLALLNSEGILSEDEKNAIRKEFRLEIDSDDASKEGEKAGESAGEAAKKSFQDKIKSMVDEGTDNATRLDKFAKDDGNSYVNDYSEEQQTRVISFVGDWSDIDDYEAEPKKAVVEFVKDVADIDKYTPEQKEAVAKFVADVDDINKWDPPTKEAIAKFIKDTTDIDNYTVDEKEVIVDFIAKNKDFLSSLELNGDEKKILLDFAVKNPDFLDGLEDDQKKIAVDFVVNNQDFLNSLGLDDKEKVIAVRFIAENKEFFDSLDNDKKEIAVELIAKNPDILNGLDNDKKEIAIDFVANNQDIFNSLEDDQKKIVIDYIVNNPGALDGLSDEDKKIYIESIVSGQEGLESLKQSLNGLSDKQIQVIANAIGSIDVDQLKNSIGQLDDKTVQAIATALGQGDVQGLQNAINGIPDQKVAQAIAQAFGYDSVEQLNNAIGGLDGKTVQAIAQALGISDVDSLRGVINSLDSKTVQAIAQAVGAGAVSSLQSAINGLTGKTVNVVANIIGAGAKLLTGGGGVDGTAHVNGTAFAGGTTGKAFKQGSWGTKEAGVALGGELGAELLVRNGRWYTIGEDGAEFFGYRKGDIIFNADQTREIFEKGKITHGNGRGRALAEGTAFSSGSGAKNPWKSSSSSSNKKSSSSSSKSSSGSKSSSSSSSSNSSSNASEEADKFEEQLDWIEILIDRIERAISRLDLKATSIFKGWTERTSALNDQISQTTREIDIQQQAYNRYIQEANKVGLSENYASKVRDGTIDIETITDEDLNDKISDYKEWYFKCYLA